MYPVRAPPYRWEDQDAWKLGKGNVATKITGLGGALGVDGPTRTNDTALELRVQTGEAPMRVNSDTRVDSLSADLLDGQDSSQFVPTNTNSFVRNSVYKLESAVDAGTDKGDGTFVKPLPREQEVATLIGGALPTAR